LKAVIPYRNCINNGLELRYAIRALVKYFKPLSGICIIGELPYWYRGEFIEMADTKDRKEFSIMSKIAKSPYEDFLYCTDDTFATQPFDETLPNLYSSTLKDATVWGRYIGRRDNTMAVYPDGLFYDIHTPMVINREKFRQAHDVNWVEKEYLSKSMYGNFIGGGVMMQDCKIRKRGQMFSPFFSTNEQTAKFINFDELYPDASEYEK